MPICDDNITLYISTETFTAHVTIGDKAKRQDKSPVGYSGKGKGKGKGQSNKINRTKKVCT